MKGRCWLYGKRRQNMPFHQLVPEKKEEHTDKIRIIPE